MLDKGPSINGRDATEDTLLRSALREKSYRIVDIMLSWYFNQRNNFASFSDDDCISFNAGCMRGRTTVIDEFIKYGILNPKSIFESSILQFKMVIWQEINELLKYKADLNFKNKVGQTALHLAQYVLYIKTFFNYYRATAVRVEKKKTVIQQISIHGLSHFHVA